MNYGELKTLLAEYLHTSAFTTAQIEGFIDRAEQRIGRDLRASENHRFETGTTDSDGQLDIGRDAAATTARVPRIRQISSVQIGSGTNLRILQAIEPDQRNLYPSSGSALAYFTYGSTDALANDDDAKLQLVPAEASVVVSVWYFEQPQPIEDYAAGDSAVTPILTAYPSLYIDGALAEASIWLRDYDGANWFTGRFDAAINKANQAYSWRAQLRPTTVYNPGTRSVGGV